MKATLASTIRKLITSAPGDFAQQVFRQRQQERLERRAFVEAVDILRDQRLGVVAELRGDGFEVADDLTPRYVKPFVHGRSAARRRSRPKDALNYCVNIGVGDTQIGSTLATGCALQLGELAVHCRQNRRQAHPRWSWRRWRWRRGRGWRRRRGRWRRRRAWRWRGRRRRRRTRGRIRRTRYTPRVIVRERARRQLAGNG